MWRLTIRPFNGKLPALSEGGCVATAEQVVHGTRGRLDRWRRPVPVGRRGHPGAGVPEHVRDLLERHASRGQQAGRGVPQLVGVPAPEASLLGDGA